MNKYKPYIYILVELLVLINAFLTARGICPVAISDAEIYTAVSYLAAAAAFFWAMWKNHNFTEAAREAQNMLDMLKSGTDVRLRYTHGGENPGDVDARTHELADPEDEDGE